MLKYGLIQIAVTTPLLTSGSHIISDESHCEISRSDM